MVALVFGLSLNNDWENSSVSSRVICLYGDSGLWSHVRGFFRICFSNAFLTMLLYVVDIVDINPSQLHCKVEPNAGSAL